MAAAGDDQIQHAKYVPRHGPVDRVGRCRATASATNGARAPVTKSPRPAGIAKAAGTTRNAGMETGTSGPPFGTSGARRYPSPLLRRSVVLALEKRMSRVGGRR